MAFTRTLLKTSLTVLALAMGGAASATTPLAGQYIVSDSASSLGGSNYLFTYTVTNVNQSAGGQTGLDGFTIFVPDTAIFLGSTHPLPAVGAEFGPGFWSEGTGSELNLMGDSSQNLAAPSGYHTYTWWGQNVESVYTPGGSATFSISLGNVAVGSNTVGISSYFGWGTPPGGQAYASNPWGNYSTFTDTRVSALAVPEPGTYAMLLAGLGIMGAVTRRRNKRG